MVIEARAQDGKYIYLIALLLVQMLTCCAHNRSKAVQ
jgi:hypothetical protein